MATIKTSIQVHDGMSSALRHMNNGLQTVITTFERMQTATNSNLDARALETLRREAALAEQSLGELEQSINQLGNQQQQTNNQINAGASSLKNLATAVMGVVSAYLSLRSLQKLVNSSDQYTNTSARIAMMNDGLQTTKELQEEIYKAAQRSYSRYDDMARMVAKIGNNAAGAFTGSKEVIAFAELIQKQFSIAGTSATEASNASLQLTQALGSGVLRGDELRAIFEQAPNIIQNIANYLDVPIGKIRSMAKEGELTAQVIKDAMFAASDDINSKFNSMPTTWSGIWTNMRNYANNRLSDVYVRLNNLFNSQTFLTFQMAATKAIDTVAQMLNILIIMLATVADRVSIVGQFFANNWTWIAPILMTVGIILGSIVAILTVVSAMKLATLAWAAAQWVVNTAYLANPITWVIIGIVAAIALVIYATATWGEETATVIGFIVGLFATLGAFLWNTIVGVINAVVQFLWTGFVEPWISIIEWVLNVFNGGFNSFGDAVANLLGQIISWFLSLGKVVTKIIDAIFGTNWTSGLSSLQASVTKWGKNEAAITIDRNAPAIDSRIEYGMAWDKGYNWGYEGTLGASSGLNGLMDKISGFGPGNQNSALMNLLDGSGLGGGPDYMDALNSINDSIDKGNKDAKLTKDDIAYLRDQVAREGITNFNQTEIKVDMKNENYINSELDIDGVIDRFGEKVEEVAESLGEEDLVYV